MDTFHKEYRGNIIVITVNLVSATLNDTNEFKGFMEEIILMTECEVVVDLSNCDHLDSTFIGALVMNFKGLKEKNRNMVLVEPNDQTKIFLTMNSLSKIFPLYPNVEIAVEDLLNRSMLEKNLTNQNHNLVFQKTDEEIRDSCDSPDEENVQALKNTDTELEKIKDLDQSEVIEENVNESVDEKSENSAVKSIEILEKTSETVEENVARTFNKMNNNSSHKQVIEEQSLAEVQDTAGANKTESEKLVPEYHKEQLVEEEETAEKDYREGTLAWDFGI